MPRKKYKPNEDYERQTKAQSTSGEWWQPRVGEKERFRVAPAVDGIRIVRRVLHYGFEVDGRSRAFPCYEDNAPWLEKQPCICCHFRNKLKEGDSDERELAKDLKGSSPKFVVQGADCNHPEKGIVKWASPLTFGKYFLSLTDDEDIEDVTDPENGFDFIIEKTGKGRGTKYDYRLRPKSTPMPIENWEEQVVNLVEEIEVPTIQEMRDILIDNFGTAFDVESYLKDFEGGNGGKGLKQSKSMDLNGGDISKMKIREIKSLIEEHDLDITDDDWEEKDELVELVIDYLEIPPF